jgi:hypothetical protein
MAEQDLQDLRDRIAASVPEATWTEPEDLSRISFEALVSQTLAGRVLDSCGTVHLTGDGVNVHQASLSALGSVMTSFQKLIDAAGAAIRGVTSPRGRLPSDIVRLTKLDLATSPLPGSVRLVVTPATRAVDEIADDVPLASFAPEDDQLADKAALLAFDLIDEGVKAGPDADQFAASVRSQGPRVASSLRGFADALAEGLFDVDLGWEQPGRPTRRVKAARADAVRISSLIEGRDLDDEEVTLEGIVVRVSKEKTALVIEDRSGEVLQIKRGKVSDDQLRPVHVDSHVRVKVMESVRESAGGTQSSIFMALSIDLLD